MKGLGISLLALAFVAALSMVVSAEESSGGAPLPQGGVSVQPGGEGGAQNAPNHLHKEIETGEMRKKMEGFGGWGGPVVSYMFINTNAFSPLTDALGIDDFPGGMFFIGGAGMGQLGPHFRIGGGGGGGNLYTEGDVLGQDRSANLTIGYGGLILYGTLPLGEKFDLFADILLGAGGLNLNAKDGTSHDIDESEGFFAWQPGIGIAYHPVGFMSLEVEASYFGMNLPNISKDGVELVKEGFAGGPMIKLNIFFGGVVKPKK